MMQNAGCRICSDFSNKPRPWGNRGIQKNWDPRSSTPSSFWIVATCQTESVLLNYPKWDQENSSMSNGLKWIQMATVALKWFELNLVGVAWAVIAAWSPSARLEYISCEILSLASRMLGVPCQSQHQAQRGSFFSRLDRDAHGRNRTQRFPLSKASNIT